MKIRIKGNSVRLRLTKTEVADLESKGFVAEETRFGTGVFRYRLEQKKDSQHLDACFENGIMTVFIPPVFVKSLLETDKVGYEDSLPGENGHTLFLLVEKDFQCLDQTREDQSDMYINPNQVC